MREAALIAFLIFGCAAVAQERTSLVISHVDAVDVARGRVETDMTVVIEGDRIIAVGQSARIQRREVPVESWTAGDDSWTVGYARPFVLRSH